MRAATCALTVMTALSVLPSVARGQEVKADADGAVQASGDDLGSIVVTARRKSERLVDVPISIVTQTAQDLSRANISNVSELAQVTPGLTFSHGGGIVFPTIRGIGTTLTQPGGETPVAIYVDGVYQPSQFAVLLDLPDTERVEVLKGPQGTLFGRNANAGAIVLHTKGPSFDTSADASVSDGVYAGRGAKSANEFSANGFITGGLAGDKLAGSLSATYRSSDGYLTNDRTGKSYGDGSNWAVRAKLLFEPQDGLRFLLTGYYSKSRDRAAEAFQPLNGVSTGAAYADAIVPTKPWHFASDAKPDYRVRTRGISLLAEAEIGDWGTLSSRSSFQKNDAFLLVSIDGTYSPSCIATFNCLTFAQNVNNKGFQQEVLFTSKDLGDLSFVVGSFYFYDKVFARAIINPPVRADGSASLSNPAIGNDGFITSEAISGFGELTWNATPRLHLIAGSRYGWESKAGFGRASFSLARAAFPAPDGKSSFTAFLPRLSARYDLSAHANIYATFSKGFKSGVLDSGAFTDSVANPEKLNSYEAGFKLGTRNVSFNLAGFYYRIEDLQVQFFNGQAAFLANAKGASIYGLDFDLDLRFSDSWSIKGGGSWVPHAKYKEFRNATAYALPASATGLTPIAGFDASGLRLLKTPKLSGNASILYSQTIGLGDIDASLNMTYASQHSWELLGRVKTNAYAVLGGQAGIHPAGSHFRFAVFVKNLTNKAYFQSTLLSVFGDGVGYSPPRQIGARIDYKL
ncbi:hypothetical protein DM806_01780 [Sphingobium lactosutens]|uniref:TonB-dependent receptor n=1 Tax=Sphingobium lactosutens TaxID=522773 RepID=UPI0015BD52DB|nr:TonB-dependent receptor [Sphingobium lactosutens]NWK94435.1 hypothetical protein [Sphingobium lactosutens]